uniref:Uncharacterized protein n=1 Tax=Rhizophora mucronata TaxID=61149 RepID=A0A2P2J984_RHIMU
MACLSKSVSALICFLFFCSLFFLSYPSLFGCCWKLSLVLLSWLLMALF